MGRSKDNNSQITEDQLRSWSLLGEFRTLLGEVPASADETSPRPPKGGPARLLLEEDYLCAFLFAQFNPIIDSMRGLCACSKFPKVQAEVCTRPMSLGSFSEAQSVFGFERLERIFKGLAAEQIQHAPRNEKLPPQLLKKLRLVDRSVFHAVPRMAWAHWRSGQRKGSAVRLHLKFRVLDQVPADAVVSKAKLCERTALEMMLESGECYVGDRNYGRDYGLLQRMDEAGCGYAMRMWEQAVMTLIASLLLARRLGKLPTKRMTEALRWHQLGVISDDELAKVLGLTPGKSRK